MFFEQQIRILEWFLKDRVIMLKVQFWNHRNTFEYWLSPELQIPLFLTQALIPFAPVSNDHTHSCYSFPALYKPHSQHTLCEVLFHCCVHLWAFSEKVIRVYDLCCNSLFDCLLPAYWPSACFLDFVSSAACPWPLAWLPSTPCLPCYTVFTGIGPLPVDFD